MSRCFPFPPPGYEKKPTTDEPDLLKKEKRKEKKHKKDKKDKEKRDGKEKREKDRSEGKHKEKKDKKDKHRDKKEKKSKSSNPDEKKVYGQFDGYNGEKVHPNDSTRSSSSSDKKQFQNGEYHEHLQKKEESKNSSSDDKKSSIQFCGQNGELVRNRSKATTGTSENNKFVQELDRRIRDEEKGTGSHQFAVDGRKNSFNRIEIQKTDGRQSIMDEAGIGRISNSTVQNKINGKTLPPFNNKIEKRVEQKEKMPEKESDDKRGDKRKNKDRDKQRQGKDKDTEKEKKEEKAKEKSEQKRAEREKNKYIRKSESVPIPVPVPNNFSARPPENSFHGIGSEGNFKKRKDMESNGVSHETEPRPNKMGRFSSNISPENGRKLDSVQNPGSSLLDNRQGASQGASMNSFKVGSKGQRVNGMIDPQPASVSSKTPPFSAFNHIPAKPSPIKSPPVITNHVAPQPPPVPTTKPQPVYPNHIAPQPPTPKPPPSIPNHISSRSPPLSSTPPQPPPSTTAKQPMSRPKPPPAVIKPPAPLPLPKKKPDPPMKPPHPDTKFLNQILSVPKLEQWCGFDDQEWLFSKKEDYPCSKKTTTEEHQVQVWSEAKHIESVDVCALPYVIPY